MAKDIRRIEHSVVFGTHAGVFHADDVFAAAVLLEVNPLASIVRTRDPKILTTCDVVFDVGGEHNPEEGRFDHHQRGRAGTRPNGVPYSSFGLVWREYGEKLCGGALDEVRLVDEALVQAVDLTDNGEMLYEGGTKRFVGANQYSISAAVSSFNPTWMESGRSFDAAFEEAVAFAKKILRREIMSAFSNLAAKNLIREAILKADGGSIVVLSKFVPWSDQVRDEAPNALFVIFLSEEGTWMVQAVNKTAGTFESRKLLPESWAGLRGKAFSEAVGIPDGVFCHPGRFICGAESRDSALRLARSAVAAA